MSRKPSQEQFTQTLGAVHPNLVFLASICVAHLTVPEPRPEVLLGVCCAHRVVGSQQPGGLKKTPGQQEVSARALTVTKTKDTPGSQVPP